MIKNVNSQIIPSVIPSVNQGAYWREDFDGYNYGANLSIGSQGLVITGGAGGGAMSTSNITQPILGRYGIAGIQLGTTSNNTANGMIFGDLSTVYAGIGEIIFDFAFKTPLALSDATNEYVLELGFNDIGATGGAGANAMIIQYKRTASTNFSAYTAKGSSVTTVTTADSSLVVTAATWYNGRIYVNAAGTRVDFYIGASGSALTLIGSSTTNIPNAVANAAAVHFQIYKASTFALNRILYLDWAQLQINFATPR